MRLERLDLTRYGKFTDFVIDFGRKIPGQPDLHIVYGPNEAGKSTTMAAYLDLLFGMGAQNRYNFLHDYKAMRVGAVLDLFGASREFARIKQPSMSLLGPDDKGLPDSAILGGLGRLDRSTYCAMFSLDDDTLEKGGESILASKGELGQLLFSATAGLSDLSATLGTIRAGGDAFYKPQAHNTRLKQLKSQLASLKANREKIDTLATTYVRLRDERDEARQYYEKALTERAEIRKQMSGVQRQLGVLPRLASLMRLRIALQPVSGLLDAPSGWAADVLDLEKQEIEQQTELRIANDDIHQLAGALQSIVLDKPALAQGVSTDALTDLRARHRTAETDIPLRRDDVRGVDLAIAQILKRLDREGESDPARLVLGVKPLSALRDLIGRHSGVEADVKRAEAEHRSAISALAEAGAAMVDAGSAPHADRDIGSVVARLSAVLEAVRKSDHVARYHTAERARGKTTGDLEQRIALLLPWKGDGTALERTPSPDLSALDRWKRDLTDASEAERRHVDALEAIDRESVPMRAELEAMERSIGLVDDQQAARIRGVREAAWAEHRRILAALSADEFEKALRQDDAVMTARLGHQKELGRFNELNIGLAKRDADRKRIEQLRDTAATRQHEVQAEVALCAVKISQDLLATTSPDEIRTWMAKRDRALDAFDGLRRVEGDLRIAREDAIRVHCDLVAALADAGVLHAPDATWDGLLHVAQDTVNREIERKGLRKSVQDREREVDKRRVALERARQHGTIWLDDWINACSACWLGENGQTPSTTEATHLLEGLSELGRQLDRRASFEARIADMQNDQKAFREAISQIAQALNIATEGVSTASLAAAVDTRIGNACIASAEHDKALAALRVARQNQAKLTQDIARNTDRMAVMAEYFSVKTLPELAAALQGAAEKAKLLAGIKDVEDEILKALGLPSITNAEEALRGADIDALEAEAATLKTRHDILDQAVQDRAVTHEKAADRVDAIGGDDAVARLDERRRTVLLEIEDQALTYLRLRAGVVAAEMALRAYRDKHRSAMMARASEAFRMISRGAYSGLTTRPDKDGDVLIAVGAGTGAKLASDLSKGTRFQLYLALRAAGYHAFASTQPTVPFIADDIMETFDDFRAEETFKLFAEMAQVGQVIYLTHHRHLCEIARQVVPNVRVHMLPTPA